MRTALLLAASYAVIATPAYAYLDGATGSLILQALIAGAATTLVFWRSQIARVKNFFSRGRKTEAQDAE
ncbi:hypothetical protein [Phenylobacterium sp.]|uniref:hypothetical protein n=1 Tax=Phenylobacterium sp. TaxID=1871053 RepID=UPI002EDA22B9